MAKISVIVPVYGVEDYLEQCLDSILLQTFRDFELILVDDGSPDGCPAICDRYGDLDPRIRVIHKKNGGVSTARNAGLEAAAGEYVTFCDSDDGYEPQWLEHLIRAAEEDRADVVVAGHRRIYSDGRQVPMSHETGFWELRDETERIRYCIDMVLTDRHAWEITTRLFRRELIGDIRFCETCGNFAEDLGFALACSFRTRRVRAVEENGYLYHIRQGSMMTSSTRVPKLDAVNEVSLFVREYFQTEFSRETEKKWYPILHFLIMMNQYAEAIKLEDYHNLGTYLKGIRQRERWEALTKQIFSCRETLTELFGKIPAGRILIYSRYCLHRCWFLFKVERFLFFKCSGYRG